MLDVHCLTTNYKGLTALNNVSLCIKAREIVALVGSNGAGKSTLLNTISGLKRAYSGSVSFLNQQIDSLPAHEITHLGLVHVPENKRLFLKLNVEDNLRLGSYLYRQRADRDSFLDYVFTLFPSLKERLKQRVETLSGGEQQMVAIGRALMTRPQLLMLDEPSQGLMPKLVDKIFCAIQDIHQKGITIFLVEQKLSESLSLAHRAYVLKAGRIFLEGSAKEIKNDPHIRQAYLGL